MQNVKIQHAWHPVSGPWCLRRGLAKVSGSRCISAIGQGMFFRGIGWSQSVSLAGKSTKLKWSGFYLELLGFKSEPPCTCQVGPLTLFVKLLWSPSGATQGKDLFAMLILFVPWPELPSSSFLLVKSRSSHNFVHFWELLKVNNMASVNNESLWVYPDSGQFSEMVLSLCHQSTMPPRLFHAFVRPLWFPSPSALAALWTKRRSLSLCQGSHKDLYLWWHFRTFCILTLQPQLYISITELVPLHCQNSILQEMFSMGNCATASGALLISPYGVRCSVPYERHNYL